MKKMILLLIVCVGFVLTSGCMKHRYHIEPDDTVSLYQLTAGEEAAPERFDFSADGDRVTLKSDGAPLEDLVKRIAGHFHLPLAFSGELRGNVTVRLRDADRMEALKIILQIGGYELTEIEGVFTIRRGETDGWVTREIRLRHLDARTLWQSLKEAFDSEVRVVPVPGHNALILSGDAEKINQLDVTISGLDRPSPAVLLEIVLLEVNRSRLEEFGISIADLASKKLSVKRYAPDGRLEDTITDFELKQGDGADPLPESLIFKMNVQALNQAGMAKIITHPHVVCRSGEKAKVEITLDNYVYIQKQSEEYSNFYFDMEKISAGVKLEIQPTITRSGHILLNFSAEESNVTNPAADTAFTVDRNTLNSTLIARDGEVLAAGGMVQKTYLGERQSVPFVEEIPLLNLLFKNRKMQKEEREIVFYIMPKRFNHQYMPHLRQMKENGE